MGLLACRALLPGPAQAESEHLAEISFRIAVPGASTVEVIGDFNGWQPGSHVLRRADNGDVWRGTFRIDAGTRRIAYQFLVDGRGRLVDAEQPVMADDFGGHNNVRRLP